MHGRCVALVLDQTVEQAELANPRTVPVRPQHVPRSRKSGDAYSRKAPRTLLQDGLCLQSRFLEGPQQREQPILAKRLATRAAVHPLFFGCGVIRAVKLLNSRCNTLEINSYGSPLRETRARVGIRVGQRQRLLLDRPAPSQSGTGIAGVGASGHLDPLIHLSREIVKSMSRKLQQG